jgi:NAD(P)-dependent dehydrogenase (short-subunit alcohol dehydrogenase family)
MMDFGLQDRVVVVTGGASGIGHATARGFRDAGATVTVLDVDRAALARVSSELDGVDTLQADVAVANDVARAHDEIVARHGRLDVAVNNAGISRPVGWLHELPEDSWDVVVGVNLKGVWLCMRAQLAQMYEQRHGVVVNTASAAGLVGAPGTSPYTASKHGVIGLTRTAALEYAPLGIRINAVAPGTVDTPMSDEFAAERALSDPFADALVRQPHPLRARARPEEIADAILFLAGDRSSFATGSVLVVDGGFSAQ